MKSLFKKLIFIYSFLSLSSVFADNQTAQLSPVLSQSGLPFHISIQKANFQLPQGVHAGAFGVYNNMWVLIAGRTNGLHGFGVDPFSAIFQNRTIYVINGTTGAVYSRSLTDPRSGLSQQQIDTLSVTSPESYQDGNTLYMVGGYGIDTATATFDTKAVLTAINLPGIIQWVTANAGTVTQNIQQIYNPIFQVAGGSLIKLGNYMQLVFGQNMSGVYNPAGSGEYIQQIRQFQIVNNGGQLAVNIGPSHPQMPDANYRRRDLNVLPAILTSGNQLQYGLIAYAGVFTPTSGVWTVPVVIDQNGSPAMADPNSPASFKQAMNQYFCASTVLYSRRLGNLYSLFFGGLSYGFFSGGSFQTDGEIPFVNQVTTVQMDRNQHFTQYIMNNQYPVIPSTFTNPGNPLLFGADAYFIPANISKYPNGVINVDNIRQSTVIGYIVGGIASTVPNTSSDLDSEASPYVFQVSLIPN